MGFRRHLGLWLSTLLLLPAMAELPGWILWTPLAAWVALLVWSAVRLPRLVAPLLGSAGVAVLVFARAPWAWIGFGLSLTVASASLGAAARIRLRAGAAVLLASVPLVAWALGFFLGPEHVAMEASTRKLLADALAKGLPFDPRMGISAATFQAYMGHVVDWVVLLLPALCVVQAPLLLAWGYSLAHAALEDGPRAIPALSRFSRMRVPDGAVWVLCVGLLLLVTRQHGVLRAGANVIAVMAAAYFCQGLSVLTFMALALRATWLIGVSLAAIGMLLLSPLFSLFTCILGLSDVWLDFRRIQGPTEELEA